MTVPYTIIPVPLSALLAREELGVIRLDAFLRTLPGVRSSVGWRGSKNLLRKLHHRQTGAVLSHGQLDARLERLLLLGLWDSWVDDGRLFLRLVHRRPPISEVRVSGSRNESLRLEETRGKTCEHPGENPGETREGRSVRLSKRESQAPETRVSGSHPSHAVERETTVAAEAGGSAPPGASAPTSPRGRARAAGPPQKSNGRGDGAEADEDPAQIRLVLEEAGLCPDANSDANRGENRWD